MFGVETAVHEARPFLRVAVDIDVQQLFVLALGYQFLSQINLLVLQLVGVLPLPVQIVPRERGPVVPVDDTVRVEHRDDLDDELVPHFLGFGVRTESEERYESRYLMMASQVKLPMVSPGCTLAVM